MIRLFKIHKKNYQIDRTVFHQKSSHQALPITAKRPESLKLKNRREKQLNGVLFVQLFPFKADLLKGEKKFYFTIPKLEVNYEKNFTVLQN